MLVLGTFMCILLHKDSLLLCQCPCTWWKSWTKWGKLTTHNTKQYCDNFIRIHSKQMATDEWLWLVQKKNRIKNKKVFTVYYYQYYYNIYPISFIFNIHIIDWYSNMNSVFDKKSVWSIYYPLIFHYVNPWNTYTLSTVLPCIIKCCLIQISHNQN